MFNQNFPSSRSTRLTSEKTSTKAGQPLIGRILKPNLASDPVVSEPPVGWACDAAVNRLVGQGTKDGQSVALKQHRDFAIRTEPARGGFRQLDRSVDNFGKFHASPGEIITQPQ